MEVISGVTEKKGGGVVQFCLVGVSSTFCSSWKCSMGVRVLVIANWKGTLFSQATCCDWPEFENACLSVLTRGGACGSVEAVHQPIWREMLKKNKKGR